MRFAALTTSYACYVSMIVAATSVFAQPFPVKPIRMITSAVGGGTDFAARLIAQGMSANLGVQVIVDNRPSGVVIGDIVAKAAPDGHTLLNISTAQAISHSAIGPALSGDTLSDGVSPAERRALILASHPLLHSGDVLRIRPRDRVGHAAFDP